MVSGLLLYLIIYGFKILVFCDLLHWGVDVGLCLSILHLLRRRFVRNRVKILLKFSMRFLMMVVGRMGCLISIGRMCSLGCSGSPEVVVFFGSFLQLNV